MSPVEVPETPGLHFDCKGTVKNICKAAYFHSPEWIQGRGLPLMDRVETKMDDAIITPDSRWISPSVLTFPFKSLRGIKRSQIVQEGERELVIGLVTTDLRTATQEPHKMALTFTVKRMETDD